MSTAPIANAEGHAADSDEAEKPAKLETNDGSLAQCEDWGEEDPIADNTELQDAAKALLKHYAALDKYARRTEVIDARRQRFYRRGDQYINWNPGIFNFVPFGGDGNDSGNGSPGQDSPRYTDVYDIFWPYMRALISVGVQNPPGVDFEPDDPTKESDISASRTAEVFRFYVDRVNNRKALQSRIMSLFCTDGRVILYTRNVRDKQKFGTDDNGDPVCVQMQSAHGVLETKVPIVSEGIHDWTYCFISDEPEINIAKSTYPQYAANIKQGASSVGESAYERMARIGVLQGTRVLQQAGDAYAHLSTRQRLWLRPAAFRHAPDAIRKQFEELYPKGMKLVVCGDAYVGSCNQSMDDHLTVAWPAPGDGSSKPSMLRNLVPVQDAFNDYKNLEKEIFDFTIPATYQDSALGDVESLREQSSEPGNHIQVTRPDGLASLADAFYSEPPSASPPSLVAAYQDLRAAFSQFQTGAQPALFGGSDEHNETKGGISMLRDQAMGQFSICWGAVQELFAGGYKQAVICRVQVEGENSKTKLNIKVPGKGGRSSIASIAIADLQKGNFHSYPDMDSSFPETTGSKRQTVMSMVTQAMANPEAVTAFGILEPGNLELQREYLGVHDWIIPAAAAYDKQMGEIELLLQQKPAPDLDAIKMHVADTAIEGAIKAKAQPLGIPLPESKPDPNQLYKCTIPIDAKWDFNQFEAQAIKDFLSSQDGIEEAKVNPWGILNVKLHGQLHLDAAAAQVAPPPGAMPPGPPKPPMPMPPPGGSMNDPAPPAIQ